MRGIPTPQGERQALTPAECAFAVTADRVGLLRKEAAAAAAALKDARNALTSALAHHGPASPETNRAKQAWREARSRMGLAQQACERAEGALETKLEQWAAEAATQHRPRLVTRPFRSEAQPPAEGGPPCRTPRK